MFELTKLNMYNVAHRYTSLSLCYSITNRLPLGYSLRKHIANALKSRSQAICAALIKYNKAAANLILCRSLLSWDEVVQYAFLADFDLLHDTRKDI